MMLHKLEKENYGGKSLVSIKYQNLHTFKEALILLCQSILETRRITFTWFSSLYNLFKSQQNFQTCLKSNFLFIFFSNILQNVFKMNGVKLTICRLSLIGIYWYHSTNRVVNSHLFMHSHKVGLSIDLMIKPLL